MEERKNLFNMINKICDENDSLRKENKCLKEEIANRENARIDIDSYVRKLLVERYRLREEMKLMVKDHEVECEDYCKMISERVNIDDLHIILAQYLTDNYTPEPAKIRFFQFLDEIKKFIDGNKKE